MVAQSVILYHFCPVLSVNTNDIGKLKALITRLLAEVKRLTARVNELEVENADKPPASEGYHKKSLIKPALPKTPGKKPGGQAGHPGKTLQMIRTPDAIQPHQAPIVSNGG